MGHQQRGTRQPPYGTANLIPIWNPQPNVRHELLCRILFFISTALAAENAPNNTQNPGSKRKTNLH
jgi:hypothetical protein